MTTQEAERMVADLAAKLHEHFDAVQILVSWNEEARCFASYKGAGNWYARQGMAHEFINMDVAQENAQQIASRINPPEPPQAEEWKV